MRWKAAARIKLFVFRPSELGGQWRGRRHRLQWSCRLLQQLSNLCAERVDRRGLRFPLISSQHEPKTIGSEEHDFSKSRATSLRNLQCEHVLELVGELA